MTDLEITKLCAEAMGLPTPEIRGEVVYCGGFNTRGFGGKSEYRSGGLLYKPLHDDAQAMALLKLLVRQKGCLTIGPSQMLWGNGQDGVWCDINNGDLNRAICECVAKMQKEKVKKP